MGGPLSHQGEMKSRAEKECIPGTTKRILLLVKRQGLGWVVQADVLGLSNPPTLAFSICRTAPNWCSGSIHVVLRQGDMHNGRGMSYLGWRGLRAV